MVENFQSRKEKLELKVDVEKKIIIIYIYFVKHLRWESVHLTQDIYINFLNKYLTEIIQLLFIGNTILTF